MPPKKTKYTKKDPIDHCLDRPDMYVGSIRLRKNEEFIAEYKDTKYSIFKKEVEFSPAIIRIFVEVLSNAIDNVERSKSTKTPCTKIKVNINQKTGETSVWNDGDVVPIEIHETENCYIHSLIFGQLLTGSNYDDEEERIISGRNGLGVKACNIFSENFTVKGCDPNNKLSFLQTWSNNMKNKTDPDVKTSSEKSGFTEIKWFPDFKRFGLTGYTNDIISLYTKFVIDAAMLTKIEVTLNNINIPVNDLVDYSKLYSSPSDEMINIKIPNMNVVLRTSTEFQAISFVNGVYTKLGGQHVDAWSEAIFRPIVNKFNKKGKPQLNIKDVKQFFRLFVISTVVRPEFDSQEKNKLESPSINAIIKKTYIDTINKWSVMHEIEDIIRSKEMVVLKKAERKKKFVKIEGLDPANNAGTKYSHDCTLILCEGLSAKTYAVAGIEQGVYGKQGRDWFGVYPLRGKCFSKGTEILLFNGQIKKVEDIEVGDILINDKGEPTNVLELFSGKDKLYEVQQLKADPYIVTSDHILTLQISSHSSIVWNNKNKSWMLSYFDKNDMKIKFKQINCIKNENDKSIIKDIEFKCEIDNCDSVYTNRSNLIRHCKKKHNGRTPSKKPFTVHNNSFKTKEEGYNEILKFLDTIERSNIIDINIQDYLKLNSHTKIHMKGFRLETYVKWEKKEVLIDPYILGMWLGDGYSNGYGFASEDVELINEWNKWAHNNDMEITHRNIDSFGIRGKNNGSVYHIGSIFSSNEKCIACSKKLSTACSSDQELQKLNIKRIIEKSKDNIKLSYPTNNNFINLLSKYNLQNNKHIPLDYIVNDKNTRLSILAGLIDTDGYVGPDGRIEIFQSIEHKNIIDSIIIICRSLGFHCNGYSKVSSFFYKGNKIYKDVYRVHISGNGLSEIPTKLLRKKLVRNDFSRSVTNTGINIIEKGIDEYYGFKTDGNHRFLLKDFTVTHNCLNVRNANPTSISKNAVITDLIQAVGLKHDIDYTDEDIFKTLQYGKIMIMTDSDSVTGDTPILVKNNHGIIMIKTIVDLAINWIINPENKKEYSTCDYKVWTENGWTEIKSVMRHKVSKNIYRVVTHTGIIDVTEDHSLLNISGEKITPSQCSLGQELLHSFPTFNENKIIIPTNLSELTVKQLHVYASQCKIQYYQTKTKECLIKELSDYCFRYENSEKLETNNITVEEAYVMGLFFTDGSCNIYDWKYIKKPIDRPKEYTFNRKSYSWAISNNNLDFLNECKNYLSNLYEFDFKIIENRSNEKKGYSKNYKLIVNGGQKTEDFIMKYRSMFYDKDCKIISPDILNSSKIIRESFFRGMYDGDGDKKTDATRIDVYKKIGAQSVFLLCKSLGYEVSVNCRDDKPDVFTLVLTKGHQQSNPNVIKKLIDLGKTEQYVYDLETENHHFHAGIGQLIVHNTDGIHIEGLLINFFHALFPTLLEREEPFIISMKTPIARVFKPKGDLLFYDERRFKTFVSQQTKAFKSKYYKGLGTTKPEDVPDTFGKKMVEYNNDEDAFSNINKVFLKKHADDRKTWLEHYDQDAGISLDDQGEIVNMNISDFINTEMIKFSHDDCKRSIPSGIDGLKESQRKILYAVKKRNLKYSGNSLKVAQLGGYVAEHTNYHHGEQNLFETITKMANEFPGSNNIPLLYRDGQFGSRTYGGKDAASPRYIFTKMEYLTMLLFPEEDDILLDYVIDDGDQVQPKFYIPIIPMILVNGSLGIGTGWSSCIPSYNPLDLIECITIWLENDGNVVESSGDIKISLFPEIKPWYRGFEGTIEKNTESRYITKGVLEEIKKGVCSVLELPVGMWTDSFKEWCEDQLETKNLKSMKNYSTPKKVHFILTESNDGLSCNIDTLKLHTYLYTSNMVVFNEKEQLKKYSTVDEIIENFCKIRFDFYVKRKKYMIEKLEHELRFLGNKERFVSEVIAEDLLILNEKESNIIEELIKRGYDKNGEGEGGYDYLLRMQVRTFTAEKVKQLKNDIASTRVKLDNIKSISEKQLWLNDLNIFSKEYNNWLKIMEKESVKKTKPKKK